MGWGWEWGQQQWGRGRDGDRAYGDGVGMGAKSVGMGWGWGQEPRRRFSMGTSSCPRAAVHNRPTHTYTQAHRQDRLQHTAPLSLARSVISSMVLRERIGQNAQKIFNPNARIHFFYFVLVKYIRNRIVRTRAKTLYLSLFLSAQYGFSFYFIFFGFSFLFCFHFSLVRCSRLSWFRVRFWAASTLA